MPRWSVWKLNTPPCTWSRWWSASGPHRYGRSPTFAAGCWISIQKRSYWLILVLPTSFCLPPSANRHCAGGWPADQREAVLRSVHVRGHPNSSARLLGWPHLARAAAQQWRDARRRVCGVPPSLECHAVRVLHPRGNTRVYSGVSASAGTSATFDFLSPGPPPIPFVLQAVLRGRPPLGGLHDHCAPWTTEAIWHPGLQLPPSEGAEARRQGWDHQECGELDFCHFWKQIIKKILTFFYISYIRSNRFWSWASPLDFTMDSLLC